MLDDVIAEYRRKLDLALKQQVQTPIRHRAIAELQYRIDSLEKAKEVIGKARSDPENGTTAAIRYVTSLLDGTIAGYETNEELVAACRKALSAHPQKWDAILPAMNAIKSHKTYPNVDEYVEDVTNFVKTVMEFFVLEREALFPLSKGGRKNEQQN